MVDLAGKVAVVTGASRGVGRGVALGRIEAGATVRVTARTVEEGSHPLGRPGSLQTLVADAAKYPGKLFAHRADHAGDAETEAVMREVIRAEGGSTSSSTSRGPVTSGWWRTSRPARALHLDRPDLGTSRCGAEMPMIGVGAERPGVPPASPRGR